MAAISQVVEQYRGVLETGTIDPEIAIPEFLEQLRLNGVDELLNEISKQLEKWEKSSGIIE